jgi:hypothetical protein
MNSGEDFLGNCETGQLTDKGYQQHYANGQDFRQAYITDTPLLSKKLTPSEVFLRSDYMDRTVQSAQAMFDGLYPADQQSCGSTNIIDIMTKDMDLDDINPNSLLCPELAAQQEAAYTSPEFQKLNETKLVPLVAELSNLLGFPVYLPGLYDCLNVHLCHNFSVPVTQKLYDQVSALVYEIENYLITYPNRFSAGRLYSGLLMKTFYDNWISAMNYSSSTSRPTAAAAPPKFFMYSAHDTSVMPMMAAFGILQEWVAYASTLTFELWKVSSSSSSASDKFGVRVLYNFKEVSNIEGCSYMNVTRSPLSLCSFDSFEPIVQRIMITDNQKQCFGSN